MLLIFTNLRQFNCDIILEHKRETDIVRSYIACLYFFVLPQARFPV